MSTTVMLDKVVIKDAGKGHSVQDSSDGFKPTPVFIQSPPKKSRFSTGFKVRRFDQNSSDPWSGSEMSTFRQLRHSQAQCYIRAIVF